MPLLDSLRSALNRTPAASKGPMDVASVLAKQAGEGSMMATLVQRAISQDVSYDSQIDKGGVKLKSSATSGTVGINDFGFKGKRQYIADRRYLVDLFVIAYNNADVRTAITHLRNEIFRRGIEWKPAFDYKCVQCEREYTVREAKQLKDPKDLYARCRRCGPWKSKDKEHFLDARGNVIPHRDSEEGPVVSEEPARPPLREPDDSQKEGFERFLKEANYFGQSLENILRECEDDINVVDDAAIFLSKEYYSDIDDEEVKSLREREEDIPEPESDVQYLFRLDPVLVEFDLDYRGVPGMRHHVCVFHREQLLDVPPDDDWEKEWHGVCETCSRRTYPVWYKYNEQYLAGGYGSAQTKVLYLLKDEVIHWSRYTPTETYGYPPVLSIYEKALTLIGMDRYLYDYFYERKVPQGVVATTTDDVEGLELRKADVQLKMQNDPHYIPWIAVNSRTGAGKTEFVRFAYSLDELNYLPVRDEIRERIAGIYGVSNLWYSASEGSGGLNNESQQLVVMSRVVEGAQRSYHTDVFEKMLDAFDITDWRLEINTPEEINEEKELNLKLMRAQWAQTLAAMGFGVKYKQDEDEYEITGEVLSMEDQQKQQAQMGMGGLMGGAGGSGGDDGGGGGGDQGGGAAPPPPPQTGGSQ